MARKKAIGAAAAGALLAAWTGARADGVQALDGDLYLGAAIHSGNVTVWPVYSKTPAERIAPDLVPLPEAQEKGFAVVRERGRETPAPTPQIQIPPSNSALPNPARTPRQVQRREHVQRVMPSPASGATVNELVIENKGDKPILVLAGTLLKGGNQDRQVGQDFIVPPGKTVPVEAFCVEKGRWHARREGKDTRGVFVAQKALATKSVRTTGQFKKSQDEVWQKVADVNRKAGKAPQTGTLFATMEADDAEAVARRKRLESTIGGALATLARQDTAPVGLAYAIDGQVREVRVFSHPLLLQRLADTLVNTIAVEGDVAAREAKAAGRVVPSAPADPAQVAALVRGAAEAPPAREKTKAGNVVDIRKARSAWSAATFADEAAARPVTKTFTAIE